MWTAYTTGTEVNIRQQPTTNSPIVATMSAKGTEVIADYVYEDEWLYVTYGIHSGYVAARYLDVLGRECYVDITSGVLNIRQAPTTNSTVLYTKRKDDAMSALAVKNDWVMVSDVKGTGWAAKQYIFIPA